MENKVVLFIGPSGSGKGTQAKLLLNFLENNDKAKKTIYFETGKNFRSFIEGDSFTANLTKRVLDEGDLLPEFLPIWLWTEFLVNKYTGEENLILDGLTRRLPEVPVFISAIKFYAIKNPVLLSINVSEKWARERLLSRGRVDDNEEDIKIRLAWYFKEVVPAIECFKKDGYFKVIEIDGEASVEDIHQDIIKKLGYVN